MSNHRIISKLGEGGMGAVYLAEHTLIGRNAVVKVLLPQLSHNKELVQRFFNEARAAAGIDHPSIVEVYDFGHHENGSAYLVLEYLRGEDLARRIELRGVLSVSEALTIIRQMSGALQAAHARGIVHRDLKPDNVFLVPDPEVFGGERIKLLDFGIAKLLDDDEGPMAQKTRTGSVMGTPSYMSPEQCRGRGDVDQRTDLYACGCILYQLLCGQPPFASEGVGEILAAHIHVPPQPLRERNPQVPPEVEALVMRLLRKDPAERPQTAAELIRGIDAVAGGTHVGPRAVTPLPFPAIEATGTNTTLGGAASEVESPESTGSSRAPWLAGASVAAVALAGAVWFVGFRDDGTAAAGDRPAAAAPEPAADELAAPLAPSPADAQVPLELAAAPPEPAMISVAVDSKPSGAQVFRQEDETELGTTPFNAEVPQSDAPVVYVLRKSGYKDEVVELDGRSGGTTKVALTSTRKKQTIRKSSTRDADKTTPTPPAPVEDDPPIKKRTVDDHGAVNPFAN